MSDVPPDSDALLISNPSGGCVGPVWQDHLYELNAASCGQPATLRHCPSPSFEGQGMSIINEDRMYCDEHWAMHLAREEQWNTEHGPNVTDVLRQQRNKDTPCEELVHPDAVLTGGIAFGNEGCFILFILAGPLLLIGIAAFLILR